MKQVEAVNRVLGIALFDDGTHGHIGGDGWFDDEGVCEPEDATFCAASDGGRWRSIDLRKLERTPTQWP